MGPSGEEDCGSVWRPYQNSARFQAYFTQDYPLYYAISELKLTEIRLALLQIVAGWLGVVAVALLCVYFWRSSLAPVAGLALTSLLVSRAFDGLYAVILPGVHLTTMSPILLFPAVTVLLIIAMLRPVLKPGSGPATAWMAVGLALIYGLHALIYYVVDTPVARCSPCGLAYVCGVGWRTGDGRWWVRCARGDRPLPSTACFEGRDADLFGGHVVQSSGQRGVRQRDDSWIVRAAVAVRPVLHGRSSMDRSGSDPRQAGAVWRSTTPTPRLAARWSGRPSRLSRSRPRRRVPAHPDADVLRAAVMFWSLRIDWIYTGTLFAIGAVNAWRARKPCFSRSHRSPVPAREPVRLAR